MQLSATEIDELLEMRATDSDQAMEMRKQMRIVETVVESENPNSFVGATTCP